MIGVVDTHCLIWYVQESPRLSANARHVLNDPTASFVVPTMVLVEIKHLEQRRRIALTLADAVTAIQADSRFSIAPMDFEVVLAAPTNLDIHDSIIVGTALALQAQGETVALLTRDDTIAQAGVVRVIW